MRRGTIGLFALAALIAGCPGGGGLGGGGGGLGDLGGGGGAGGETGGVAQCASNDWGTGEAALKLSGFLGASASFLGAVDDIQTSVIDTCKEMGSALGVAEGEMSGSDPKKVCQPVIAKLQAEMSNLKASANVQIAVAATPPECSVKVDAYAKCAGECDASVDPGSVDVQCEGGELVGQCSGECQGSCSVEASAGCEGTCEGTCTGGCQGTCNGGCDGECSATNAEGQCEGTCDGTCTGTCEGGCEGSCEGSCWVEGQAECQGECKGGCSVDYEAPRCTGEVVPPSVSAECKASCDAKLDAEAECTPGKVEVVIKGDLDENLTATADKLKAALKAGFGQVKMLGAKLARLKASGKGLVDASVELKGAVTGMGMKSIKAGECIASTASALPKALASVGVSVDVNVSMTAAVSAGG